MAQSPKKVWIIVVPLSRRWWQKLKPTSTPGSLFLLWQDQDNNDHGHLALWFFHENSGWWVLDPLTPLLLSQSNWPSEDWRNWKTSGSAIIWAALAYSEWVNSQQKHNKKCWLGKSSDPNLPEVTISLSCLFSLWTFERIYYTHCLHYLLTFW